jgi:hypothetical protein
MSTRRTLPAVALLLLFAILGDQSARSDPQGDTSIDVPATHLKFYQDKEGLTVANAWGDPANGAHSNFIKISANTASPLHTHTQSYYGVVITGVVVNQPAANGPDEPLMPGSYWYQKGGEPHVTKCISQTECLIFVTSKGSFDFLLVK